MGEVSQYNPLKSGAVVESVNVVTSVTKHVAQGVKDQGQEIFDHYIFIKIFYLGLL